jgi:hypothetical protein
MPTFTFDITSEAINFVKESVNQLTPGNAGQASLIESLNVNAKAELEVRIAGPEVETEATGYCFINSSHPEAIEDFISAGNAGFDSFLEGCSDVSFAASASLNMIEQIRQDYVDEAFKSL